MLLKRFNQTFIEANCYIFANQQTNTALVIDPGAGSSKFVEETLKNENLVLGAVILTHGHPDHCWEAAKVAGDKPVYCPEPDLYRMDNPALAISEDFVRAIEAENYGTWVCPQNLSPLPSQIMQGSGGEIVSGIYLRGIAAPGHSEGSTVFYANMISELELPFLDVESASKDSLTTLMFGGDVLFPNGVGRTDLPGSDPVVMESSIRTLKQVTPPSTIVLPGHDRAITMRWINMHNPYMLDTLQDENTETCGSCNCGSGGCCSGN